MATSEYSNFVTQISYGAFRDIHNPGIPAPYGGIYRCEVCAHEIAIAERHTLPSQNHGQHSPAGQSAGG